MSNLRFTGARRGTVTVTDQATGVEITVSKVAYMHLTPDAQLIFLAKLADFMATVGSDRAYVSKQGSGLCVSLIWSCK